METIKIGKIVKPHGVRGELKVYSSSDFIMDRLKKNAVVILEKNGKKTFYWSSGEYLFGLFVDIEFSEETISEMISSVAEKD